MIEIPIWLLIVMIFLIVVLGTMLWTNLREREFHVKIPDVDSFEEALPSIAGMTKAILLEGNKAELFYNGQYFKELLEAIANARETVHFETYVWWSGDICDQVAAFFGQDQRLQHIDRLGNISHGYAFAVVMENVEGQSRHQGIAHAVLLVEEAGIGARLDGIPGAPFIDDQLDSLVRIMAVHNRHVLGD